MLDLLAHQISLLKRENNWGHFLAINVKITNEQLRRYGLAFYITAIVTAIAGGSKIVPFFGLQMLVSVIPYMFTFAINDLVNRHLGADEAKKFIIPGILAQVTAVFLFIVFVSYPPHANFERFNENYIAILAPAIHFFIGSTLALFFSQSLNRRLFTRFDNEKGLKMTSQPLSNFFANIMDTFVFVLVGFYLSPLILGQFIPLFPIDGGILNPWADFGELFGGQSIVKILFTLLIWPVFLFVSREISKGEGDPPMAN